MANQVQLAKWLTDNKSRISAKVIQLKWTEEHLFGLHDFISVLEIGDVKVEGRGVGTSVTHAVDKSIAEAVERYHCKARHENSDGYAVGDENFGPLNAENELLERFFLDCHLRGKITIVAFSFPFRKNSRGFPGAQPKSILAIF